MPTKKTELDKLREENRRLKRELRAVEMHEQTKGSRAKQFWKWASLSLAGAIFIVGSLLFYVGLTLTNTNRFMEVASPLIEQPAVQQVVAQKTTDALFEQVNTQELLTEILPERVDFLAPQLSVQIEKLVNDKAKDVIASQQFHDVWDTTLRTAHEKLIAGLKDYKGDGTISITDVYNSLSVQLADTKASFLANKTLPPRIGNITVVQADWLPAAHNVVVNITLWRVLAIGFLLILLVISVWLSQNRRKGLIHVGMLIGLLSLAILIALRIAREIYVNSTAPEYRAAIDETWQVIANPFRLQMIGEMLFGFVLAGVAWLGGPSKSASSVRGGIENVFAGRLHQAVFKKGDNGLTRWLGRYKRIIMSVIAGLFILSFLFISLSVQSIIAVCVVAAVLVLILETLASPKV